MGVAPPGTLAHCFAIRGGGFAPATTYHNTHLIIYALVIVTNNYTIKKNRDGAGAKPPPRAERALLLLENCGMSALARVEPVF